MPEDKSLICSFCSKSRKDVTKMIVGATKVAICNECIKLCVEILDEDVIKTKAEQWDSYQTNRRTSLMEKLTDDSDKDIAEGLSFKSF